MASASFRALDLLNKAPLLPLPPPHQDIVAMLSDHGLKIACYHLVRDKTFDHDDVDTDLDGEALSHSSIAPR